MSDARYRIGYCTSGLAHHRLEDALHLLARLGYRGVFLTLDPAHLDPLADEAFKRAESIGRLLKSLDLEAVVETGGRFVLDPARKHWPNLVSSRDAERREAFMLRAIDLALPLGSKVVSFWSGAQDDDAPPDQVYDRLLPRIRRLLEHASRSKITLALEPEPGMFIETVEHYHALCRHLGANSGLKLSLDCGHLLVTGEGRPEDLVRRESPNLACVAIEDMRRGIHEHLPFGQGDLDLPPLITALADSGFEGVVAVELGRHSHDGPNLARSSREVLARLGVPFGGA